jgi:hypothetical protein
VGGELRFDAAVSAASAASASASTATAVAYRDPAWPRNALAMGAVPLTAADFALLQVSVSIPRTSVWVLRELRLGSTHKSHAAMPSRVSILLSTHMTTNPRMNLRTHSRLWGLLAAGGATRCRAHTHRRAAKRGAGRDRHAASSAVSHTRWASSRLNMKPML